MNSLLGDPVDRFVEDITPVLAGLSTKPDTAAVDVALEAFNIAAAFIDVDDRHTDDELWSLVTTFGARFDTMLAYATPADVRRDGLVAGKKDWLSAPSTLFEILLADDRRRASDNAWRYYEAAMAIAHAVSALDRHPARAELQAIDAYRALLLSAMGGPPRARSASPVPAGGRSPATEQAEPAEPIEVVLAELDALIGLAPVKAEVRLVANLIRVQKLRQDRGLAVAESSRHLIFTGNPGTGKTTVARMLARIYRSLGVVTKGHLVETDRSQLVAGFVGQTAIQVRQVVESAVGGVLLIDEAYALVRGGERDFGREAIDTLVKLMEDHREDVVVVAAGYTEEMAGFVDSNPGLRSRFPKTIHFPDYTDAELVAIFESMCQKSAYTCAPSVRERLTGWFAGQVRDKGFGNARLARNLFEASVARHASRVVEMSDPTDAQLSELSPDDIC